MSEEFADTWDGQMLLNAKKATLEHDAVELMLEINLERAVWKTPMDSAAIEKVLQEKFGDEAWQRISAQATELLKRKLGGYNDKVPTPIILSPRLYTNTQK